MKQSTDVNPAAASRVTTAASVALLLLGLPLLTALVGLAKTSVNIPLTDDYDAITQFLNRYVHTPALWRVSVGSSPRSTISTS